MHSDETEEGECKAFGLKVEIKIIHYPIRKQNWFDVYLFIENLVFTDTSDIIDVLMQEENQYYLICISYTDFITNKITL